MPSTSASAPHCPAPWRAMLNQKFRTWAGARRLLRRAALAGAGPARGRAGARALRGRPRALLDGGRAGPDYRAAGAAHRGGAGAALARLLPAISAGLEPAPAPADLFAAL